MACQTQPTTPIVAPIVSNPSNTSANTLPLATKCRYDATTSKINNWPSTTHTTNCQPEPSETKHGNQNQSQRAKPNANRMQNTHVVPPTIHP